MKRFLQALRTQVTNIQRTAVNEKLHKNNKQNVKLYHARGGVSKQCILDYNGARESCRDVWVNRVRLASDRASTDCYTTAVHGLLLQNWLEPQKNPSNT